MYRTICGKNETKQNLCETKQKHTAGSHSIGVFINMENFKCREDIGATIYSVYTEGTFYSRLSFLGTYDLRSELRSIKRKELLTQPDS